MARPIAAGIDIGTSHIKVVIAEEVIKGGRATPQIIGTATAESRGMERGYITDPREAAQSIRQALNKAEKMAGEKVRRAYCSAGGVGLQSLTANGSVIITRADLEITDRDLELALETAESNLSATSLLNRKIINSIPLEYKVDGKPVWGRVEGLKGQKLEVKALFLTAMEHHLQDTIKTVELAGVEVIDLVASPVAASFVTLSKKQKKAGCLLVDIGAETLSVIVFENDNLLSLEVFPVGSADLTNDIALGLKIPLEEAEVVKLGGLSRTTYSHKKLGDIVSACFSDWFGLIDGHLKKIGRDSLLPAGIIMTGGGAGQDKIREFAEEYLKLPSQVAEIRFSASDKGRVKDHVWAVACGLSIIGFNADNEQTLVGEKRGQTIFYNLKSIFRKLGEIISRFLP